MRDFPSRQRVFRRFRSLSITLRALPESSLALTAFRALRAMKDSLLRTSPTKAIFLYDSSVTIILARIR